MEKDLNAQSGENEDAEHEPIEYLTITTRAIPQLEIKRATRDQQTDVLWGV
jgi:hypothetical protein